MPVKGRDASFYTGGVPMSKNNERKNVLQRLLTDRRVRVMSVCLCLSVFLWLFVTLGKNYQYTLSVPLTFESSEQPDRQFFCSDSVVEVHLTTNGFDWLTSSLSVRRAGTLHIDVASLSMNMKSGYAKIPMGFLNKQVLGAIGMSNVPMEIMPDTLSLRWKKTYSKSVPLVGRVRVECEQPFALFGTPKLLVNRIELEGTRDELEKTDTLYTKEITLKGVNRNLITFVPVDFDYSSDRLNVQMSMVGLRVEVKEYTENTIELPVEVITGRGEKIKLYPPTVKLRYKVAMDDYRKVNTDDITAYVLAEGSNRKRKLRVMLNNLPEMIKVMSIEPPKLDYVIKK